jgi:CxxC-x17-CxxC domain-containing protein
MGDFRSSNEGFDRRSSGRGSSGGFGGRRSFGGNRFGGRGDSRGRDGDSGGFDRRNNDDRGSRRPSFVKHEVTCDKCGKLCDVPFKPTTGKPIYCRDCFGAEKSGSGSSGMSAEQFEKINEKLNKILKILENVEIEDDDGEDDDEEDGEEETKNEEELGSRSR